VRRITAEQVKRIVRRGAFVALLASPAAANGADPPRRIALAWHAPADCPGQDWAQRALDAYLGDRKIDAFKPMSVRVDIESSGGRYLADLRLEGAAAGDRQFEGASCARVADAAVLIVALMLDPVEVATQIEAPRAEARGSRVEPGPPADRGAREPARTRKAQGRRVQIGVQAIGDAGSLPGPSVGGGVTAGVRVSHMRIEMDAAVWMPARAFGGPVPGSGGEIGLFTAGLRGCYAPLRAESGVALEPCARIEGGVARGRGFGLEDVASSNAPWGAIFAGIALRQWTAESFAAWLSIEGGAPFVRPNHVIEGFGTVFRAGPALGRLSFGLAWSFP
jgi:hypothetical protein